MKKPDKRETINLFFSAFLIIAFIVCAHFFTQFTSTLDSVVGSIVSIVLYVVFGLLLFYATRVGDGVAVKRFSIITLLVLVLPSLYIIVAGVAPGLPLHDIFAAKDGGLNVIVTLACVALGYGIPYIFLSGFEIKGDDDAIENEVLEGGVEADVIEAPEEEAETEPTENVAEAETEENTEETTEEVTEE